MSASSYSRVLNRNRLRTTSSAASTAVAPTTTHHGRTRPRADEAPPVPAVSARAGAACSLLMLTWPSPMESEA